MFTNGTFVLKYYIILVDKCFVIHRRKYEKIYFNYNGSDDGFYGRL